MANLKYLLTKNFWRWVLYAVIFYIIVLILVFVGLRFYTLHGKSMQVPDFKGLTTDRAVKLAKYNHMKMQIIDSVYIPYLPKGSIIDQNPKPGVNVKRNHTIFVSTNAFNQARVEMPNIIGVSFRQGKTTLESRGLKVGRLIYKPDFAENNILDQLLNGKTINTGQLVEKGQTIDLVLGNGYGRRTSPIPNVYNNNYYSAVSAINDAYLNIGIVTFDTSVHNYHDTINAKVYKQRPVFYESGRAVFGSKVDLWLSVNPNVFINDTVNQ